MRVGLAQGMNQGGRPGGCSNREGCRAGNNSGENSSGENRTGESRTGGHTGRALSWPHSRRPRSSDPRPERRPRASFRPDRQRHRRRHPAHPLRRGVRSSVSCAPSFRLVTEERSKPANVNGMDLHPEGQAAFFESRSLTSRG
jgi:hypothetical protein